MWLLFALMLLASPLRDVWAVTDAPMFASHAMPTSMSMAMTDAAEPCEGMACAEMPDCELVCALNASVAPLVLLMPAADLLTMPMYRRLHYSPIASSPQSRRPDPILRPPIA